MANILHTGRLALFASILAAHALATLLSTDAAAADGVSRGMLPLHGAERGALVTPYAELLEDLTARLDLPSVRAVRDRWRPGPRDALAFGFSQSAWWVRWRMRNDNDRAVQFTIDLGNPRQDFVEWYVLRNDSADASNLRIERFSGGDRLPFHARELPTRNFALPLSLAAREQVDIYIRLQSYDGLFEAMPIRVFANDTFQAEAAKEDLLLSLFHGGLLALALYNLLLFVATRRRAFGIYVLYVASFLFWSFTFRGFSFAYLWPDQPAFNNDILTVGAAWTFAAIGLFAVAYLRLHETAPRWLLRTNVTLIVLNFSVAGPALMGYYALGAGIGHVTGVAMAVATLGTALWLAVRRPATVGSAGQALATPDAIALISRQAKFFVVAFTAVGVGACAYILQIVAILPTNWFTTWAVQIGSAIEVLLLALGLADSINILKARALAAEQRARAAQEALNAQLALQIHQRTEELALANRKLHELAITDEQTGAFNRRHFTAFCAATLNHRTERKPLALCMFDIDFLKSFNERAGHEAGDEVVRKIAQAINAEVRRHGDALFRLGGEEFGVLYAAPTARAALDYAERLRAIVCELRIPHERNPTGHVTASFGVGWWNVERLERLSPDRMYATVDNMLYEAKESGRNCVRLEDGTAAIAGAEDSATSSAMPVADRGR
jgi:diguanylate cyclase (GGDEF)-like protein